MNLGRIHRLLSTKTTSKLTAEQRLMLAEMLRVNHAGELGADAIYKGQYAILGRDKRVGPVVKVCYLLLGWIAKNNSTNYTFEYSIRKL